MHGEPVEADAAPEIQPELSLLQKTLGRDGVRDARMPGRIREDCPPNPAVDAGSDCIVYRVFGSQERPVADGQPIHARLRVWVRPDDGGWEVHHYEYDVLADL